MIFLSRALRKGFGKVLMEARGKREGRISGRGLAKREGRGSANLIDQGEKK